MRRVLAEGLMKIYMGNAKDAVKKEAVFVSETNENDGVAVAIEKYALA